MRFLAGLLFTCAAMAAPKTLDIYFIDVEGGQATLIVTPSKQSLLIDAGWPGFENRDAKRIAAAAKKAGIKKIDFLVTTHFHRDHVGGVPEIAALLPVGTFIDHGPNRESGKAADELFLAYRKVMEQAKRMVVKPGDTIPLKGVEVEVLSADGNLIGQARKGAGAANPLCAAEKRKEDDPTENARSLGTFLTYGKFRFIDLGDLTWNKELELVCPANKIGQVDVYLTTHHGMDMSGPAAIVHALKPRVAIMNNGARKGGSAPAWQAVHSSPGLEDLWQLHYAEAGGKENNAPDAFIANPVDEGVGNWIRLSAEASGAFTVYNSRNKYQKTYAAR
jgi:competence protein ComEC